MTEEQKHLIELAIHFGLALGAIIGGIVTIRTYLRSAAIRRSEWLHTLFTAFFEKQTYDNMRRMLDYKGHEFQRLVSELADGSGNQHTLREELVDYLNFFEFIATLYRSGQLSLNEILMLFDYYIRCLNHHSTIREYVRLHGFEGLNELIDRAESRYQQEHGSATSLLFVYGTLMSHAENEITDIFARHATKVSDGTFQGKMYRVSRPDGSLVYPAVVPSDNESDVVYGEIYRLSSPSIFARLDEYEECGARSPRPHEYRREVVDVKGPSGEAARSYIYLYSRPTDHLRPISSGTFKQEIQGQLTQGEKGEQTDQREPE